VPLNTPIFVRAIPYLVTWIATVFSYSVIGFYILLAKYERIGAIDCKMMDGKVVIMVLFSALADIVGGIFFAILGVPDKLDVLTNTGSIIINTTANTLPTNAPQQLYTMSVISVNLLKLIPAALAFLPFALIIGAILLWGLSRNN
jgi:hypothetical protein